MATYKGPAKKLLSTKATIWIICLIGITTLIFLQISKKQENPTFLGGYPIAADAEDIKLEIGKIKEIEVRPGCWSGWISTPIVPFRINFRVQAPGDLEYYFWTGERISVKDNEKKWLGEILHNNFRLRGTAGKVKIKVEKA